jgi:hypothetical protein
MRRAEEDDVIEAVREDELASILAQLRDGAEVGAGQFADPRQAESRRVLGECLRVYFGFLHPSLGYVLRANPAKRANR